MERFEDHFLNSSPVGVYFDEEPKCFDPEAQEEFLDPQPAIEESIYSDDLVKVYLREIGAVFARTRETAVPATMEAGDWPDAEQ